MGGKGARVLLGKYKLKPQSNTTTSLSEWLTFRKLISTNAGQEAEQLKLPFLAGWNAKWYSSLEDSLALSYNKCGLTI